MHWRTVSIAVLAAAGVAAGVVAAGAEENPADSPTLRLADPVAGINVTLSETDTATRVTVDAGRATSKTREALARGADMDCRFTGPPRHAVSSAATGHGTYQSKGFRLRLVFDDDGRSVVNAPKLLEDLSAPMCIVFSDDDHEALAIARLTY